ncbi:MAG: lamin tail domain-containing protein [Bacteroidales bacterium]|nr:lamin tail domain-containing protein [Bacteroidales bacterium]
MKILFIIFVGWLYLHPATGFAQWTDDFSDGDFSSNPEWTGNTGKFHVDGGWLRLNDDAAGTSYLSTVSDVAADAVWEFVFRLTFNPSGSSYARVYLTSDQPDLTAPLNGYFLQLGSTADDICLFRKDGSAVEKLITGRPSLLNASSSHVRVSVTRDIQGKWSLYTKLQSETADVCEGETEDDRIQTSAFFGVVCTYAKSYSTGFYFDDFHVDGQSYVDTDAPEVIFLESGQDQLRIAFSEPVTTTGVREHHFTAAENIFPEQALPDESQTCFTLIFPESLQCGVSHPLFVAGLTDAEGNIMRDTTLLFSVPCRAALHDIVINEVMADPSPVIYLPEYEYIELYNRSGKNLEMEGWKLTYGNTVKTFPEYFFTKGSYLLLVHPNAVEEMSAYGTTLPLLGAQSAITNDGQYLMLQDGEGAVISWMEFNMDWYADEYKEAGGWSLEQIDPEQPCSGLFNWKASIDRKGGTPGKENSVFAVNADERLPQIQRIAVPDEHTVILYASKTFGAVTPSFSTKPEVGVMNAQIAGSHFDRLELTLQAALQEQQWYEISVSGDMTDCAGYTVPPAHFRFSPPQYVDSMDIIINEVLFQPVAGGYTFIELYNRSQKAVRVSDLQMAMRSADGRLSTPASLTEEPFLLFPGEFLVVSRNTDAIIRQYNAERPECFLRMMNMPSLTKESGRLVLLDKSLRVVDEIHYNNKYHSDFLQESAGVSLERIHPDRNSLDPSNWHTSAQTAGFATPGEKNSQYVEAAASGQNSVTLLPEVFSPDNDGMDDVLNICYRFDIPSPVADVIVLDAAGRRVRYLLRQQILDTDGVITWDGSDELNRKIPAGLYIIYVHVYHASGFNRIFKLPCVLAGKKIY